MEYNQYVGYAIFAAEQVIDIYEKKYPDDKRPREAIEVAKECLKNPSKKNKDAAYATYAATYATYAAATYATYAAACAAGKEMKLKILNYGMGLLGSCKTKMEG